MKSLVTCRVPVLVWMELSGSQVVSWPGSGFPVMVAWSGAWEPLVVLLPPLLVQVTLGLLLLSLVLLVEVPLLEVVLGQIAARKAGSGCHGWLVLQSECKTSGDHHGEILRYERPRRSEEELHLHPSRPASDRP